MGSVLSDEKQQQVIALGRLGWSLRRIEAAMGVRRETASGYLKAAGVGVRPPRRWGKTKPANEGTTEVGPAGEASSSGAKPANEGTTDAAPRSRAAVRHMRASIVAPYVDLVQQRLEVGRNARAVYEELVDTQGYTGSYISVRRFVRTLRDSQGPEAKAVIHTAPGEEAQMDYGEGPMVRHLETGKYRRTRMFVLTLGYSRKSVRLLCWKSSSRTWAQLHEEAFRRLGGVARTVVLDNLREGVLAADVYEPALNPLFRDVLAHYGATALPARVRHPDRKGKVESAVGHAQRTPLKGLRFECPLRLSGMAQALEARLLQAQAEKLAPLDFLSALVNDELTRRSDSFIQRRLKQGAFRDAGKTLDGFDFDFNKKMNRRLVFELATGGFVERREDALFLGPPGTGKSHIAQAIGRAVIQSQGHRVLYREAHHLLEELAESSLEGTRRQKLDALTSAPLLVIDDRGMRKLPATAAEDLLELIMHRYEKASTLITSNRPVEDWGKLLGDNAAVAAMLDRLLHHAHVVQFGPRSWRTKGAMELRSAESAG
ncbi:IS21-like element helper ATPase IstB [Myxococcus fulvus]|uniref:IS21-like element helper ATPase IstB n=1 Tax=Myxococcus fulvus TaxID=33 RepID=UPI00237B3807|nr:IS21-like element helper ATPase IstB [Myxococcus fulvus]